MTTSCEFEFGFWDVTAREDAAFLVSSNQPFAHIEDMNTENGAEFPDVVTLEPGFGWPLDGSKVWFPSDSSAYTWGWWSEELSGEDGGFSNPPKLITTFTENHSSAGVTLRFYATLPKTVNIKWYDLSGRLLADEDFSPDSMLYFCDCLVENYGKVVITIPAMSAAQRFLRCTYILFGALEILDGTRVEKATLCEEVSPVGLTLPINTLTLSFHDDKGRFRLLDPSGAYRLFQWKQQVAATATVDGERRGMGIFYLQEMEGEVDSLVDLQLVNIVGILDTIDFDGGIYEDVPVRELLDAILGPEGIEYSLDASFEGETLRGYLPIDSKRCALQQIAVALGAVVDTTREEIIRIYPMPVVADHTVTPARKVVGHRVVLEELFTRVDVTAHTYQLSEETRELSKTVELPGRRRITFRAPAAVEAVTGGTLVESHHNYAVVDVAAEGEVRVTGREYVDNTTVYTAQIDPLPAGIKSSTKPIKDATLIDPARASAVARRLLSYYQMRYTDEGQLLPGDEKIGQVIELQSIGGKSLTGPIQRLTVDLTGGYLIKATMRGA